MAQTPKEQTVQLTLDTSQVMADLEKIKARVLDLVDLDQLADLLAPKVVEILRARAAEAVPPKTTPDNLTPTQRKNYEATRHSSKPELKLVSGETSSLHTPLQSERPN